MILEAKYKKSIENGAGYCPYCGSMRSELIEEEFLKMYHLRCKNCGATGGHGVNPMLALNMWNRRFNPDGDDND